MKNKFLKLFQAFLFIVGGLMITYGSVGAITKIMVPRGGTGAGVFQDGAFLTGSGTSPISTSSDIVVVGGKIGIGTLTPSVKLSVGTAIGENAYFFYDNADVGNANNSQSLRVYRRASEGDSYINLYNNADKISQVQGSVGLNLSSPNKISFGSSTPSGAFTFQEALNSAQDAFVVADHTGKTMFLIDSSGKVGIGASSPSNNLQIKGTNAGIDIYNTNSNKTFNIEFSGNSEFLIGGPDVDTIFLGNNEGADYIEIKNSENFIALGDLEYNETGSYFSVNSTDKEAFFNDMDVGIGTATPARPLHMVGDGTSASGWARFGLSATEYTEIGHRGSNSAINAVGDGNLDFRHDNNTKMTIKDNGHIGINTTNPGEELNVMGNILVGSVSPLFGGLYDLSIVCPDGAAAYIVNAPTSSLTGRAFAVGETGQNFVRVIFYSNSFIGMGPGTATRDTFIGRSAANTLRIGSVYDGTGTGHLIVNGNVGIGTTSPSQKLSVSGNVLADSYIEYSKKYSGNALKKIINIKCEEGSQKGDWCNIDHDTLPLGVRYEKKNIEYTFDTDEFKMVENWDEELNATTTEKEFKTATSTYDFVGRDLGANVQLNTKAIQELYEIMVKQTERIEELENILAELGIFCK